MKILGVIPARYESSRLPGKPLVTIGGRTLIQHVYQAAAECQQLDDLVVGTDSDRVAETVEAFGGTVEMTRPDHLSGTDRVAEVADRRPDAGVVVNIQGDLPFLKPAMIERLLVPYVEGGSPHMTTVASPLDPNADPADPNIVKVVRDKKDRALYFSRAVIPHRLPDTPVELLHHVGLYAFRRDFLLDFTQIEPGPLERSESLEQLRALENGYDIIVTLIDEAAIEINTPEDHRRAEALLGGRA